mmetsp:Transcript_17573/g.53118  ORF Transcript_17573/g.53118 Transcript_17573/m.53118 type:complete len:235 (-) Transcript_17573:396-1100(-)
MPPLLHSSPSWLQLSRLYVRAPCVTLLWNANCSNSLLRVNSCRASRAWVQPHVSWRLQLEALPAETAQSSSLSSHSFAKLARRRDLGVRHKIFRADMRRSCMVPLLQLLSSRGRLVSISRAPFWMPRGEISPLFFYSRLWWSCWDSAHSQRGGTLSGPLTDPHPSFQLRVTRTRQRVSFCTSFSSPRHPIRAHELNAVCSEACRRRCLGALDHNGQSRRQPRTLTLLNCRGCLG